MGGDVSSPIVLVGDIMIVLKKDNHYMHTESLEVAQEKVNDGYEVLKNKFPGVKIVKQEPKAAPKKKMFAKKKK
jgi:hypothetical protein